jgi:hypothetical protein
MDISKNNAQKSRLCSKRKKQEKDGSKRKDPRQTPSLTPKRKRKTKKDKVIWKTTLQYSRIKRMNHLSMEMLALCNLPKAVRQSQRQHQNHFESWI